MLKGLDTNIDILKIVREIIESGKQRSNIILVEDIKGVISPAKTDGASVSAEQHFSVLSDPTGNVNTAEGAEGYSALFHSRFEKTVRIFSERPDSKRLARISYAKQRMNDASQDNKKKSAETVLVAGLLMSKRSKKNGLELVIDDYTDTLTALVVNEDVKKQASLLALDQAVMLELENGRGFPGLAIKNVISPDIPDHVPNRSKSEAYAVLISDLHVGSKYFMEKEFLGFLEWLSSDDEMIKKVKFLCFGGDLVDGIGIFPNQDKELLETDPSRQMGRACELLAKIPRHIKVFVIPGNHDPGRRALPQPSLAVSGLDGFTMLGNPGLVELNGVKILMYHGQSLDDVIATTPGMSYSKPAEAMKVLLRARHLSPVYGERTPIAPEQEDMMVISEVPDIFQAGHVHVVDFQNYRGTLIVNSGAWQRQTKYQQTMGITPTPGIAVLVNLATLQPFTRDFSRPEL